MIRAPWPESLARIGFLSFAFGLSFSIAWAHASLAILAAGWILWRFSGKGAPWVWGGLAWPLLLFCGTAFLGALAGFEFGFHPHDLAKAAGLPLVLLLTATVARARPEWATQARRVFLAGLGIHALYALLVWAQEGLNAGFFQARVRGSFSMALTFAEVMTMGILVYAASAKTAKESRLGAWLMPGAVLALILTFGRGAMLGLASGFMALILLKRPRWGPAALGGILVLILVWAWAGPKIASGPSGGPLYRLMNFADPDSSFSNRARINLARSGFALILARPLGVGPGNVIEALPPFKVEDHSRWKKRWDSSRYGHLHNNFLQVAAERGLLGLGALVWLLVAMARSFLSRARGGDPVAAGSLVAGLAFLVCGMTEYTLGDSSAVLVFWFLAGLGLAL